VTKDLVERARLYALLPSALVAFNTAITGLRALTRRP